MNKSVDPFRMSAELQCDKELTMLRNECAALKAQVNSLRNALSGYCSDESPDGWDAISAFTRTPQACLNDHNARIEEEAIERLIKKIAYEIDWIAPSNFEMIANDMPRKYGGDK